MKINLYHEMYSLNIEIFDHNYKIVPLDDNITTGWMETDAKTRWDGDSHIFKGSFSCDVSKGTYYIRFKQVHSDSGNAKFKVTVLGSDKTEAISAPAIVLKKGNTVALGAIVSGKKTTNVSLSTSDKKVAKVDSDGVVTGVGKGTAVITIKNGKKTYQIGIIVE